MHLEYHVNSKCRKSLSKSEGQWRKGRTKVNKKRIRKVVGEKPKMVKDGKKIKRKGAIIEVEKK